MCDWLCGDVSRPESEYCLECVQSRDAVACGFERERECVCVCVCACVCVHACQCVWCG